MSQPLWSPSAEAIANSELTRFTTWLEVETGHRFSNYHELHNWSVENAAAFWQKFYQFSDVVGSEPKVAVEQFDALPGARWFPDATLNFAENLLVERSNRVAFVSLLENGERTELSYNQLFVQTEKISSALRHLGIAKGDRIAGWLPNTPHAAVAMLASSSIGAIWSSCSPDFGASGALDRFGQIEPRVLFACDGYFYGGKVINTVAKVREVVRAVPSIEQVVWVSILNEPPELGSHEIHWEDWLSQTPSPLTFDALSFNHPLYILYSSGTTGVPKCIVHGQGGTLLQHRKEHMLHINLTAEDTLFFFTTCGWMMWNWLVSALATRCTVVLYDGSPFHPTPNSMFDLAEREQVSVFGISAKFLSGAQKQGVQPARTHNLNQMKTLISTGSPLTHEGFQFVYDDIKSDCHLISMSGGTDIVSCFMLGNPNQPVYAGELQSPGLGMAVEIWDDNGQAIVEEKGELVCTRAFPSCPIGFWNDPGDKKFLAAYFDRYANVWLHGDYAEQTTTGGYIIHGRSDAVLNPGGVRIGTAEIYRQIEHFEDIIDAVCVGQEWEDDVRVILFVVLQPGTELTEQLIGEVKLRIRQYASPRHTPAHVIAVNDIPRTMSGKIAELAVREAIHGRPVKNTSALANPEALEAFQRLQIN